MRGFHRLDETELAGLDDADLVAHALAAREAGEWEQAGLALKIFAFGMEEPVRAFVRGRLRSHGDTVVDEVVERALESALRSIESLAGATPEQARAFVFRIARRRIADFLRKGRLGLEPLDEAEGGEGAPPRGLVVEDGAGEVEASLLVAELLGRLREDHRQAVELNVLAGYSARETVELIGSRDGGPGDDSMSEQNVHQIASRFRAELRARIAGEGLGEVSG